MKVVSWNVNGLRSVFNKGFLDYLSSDSPDLLCLQESKVMLEQLSEEQISPPGYSLLLNSAKRKGYSGVAIYLKDSFPKPIEVSTGLGEELFDSEGRYIVAKFKDFTLYNIYFPSGTSGDERQKFKYDFLEHLYEHFSAMPEAERNKSIICGDYNICHRAIDIHHPSVAEKRGLSGFLPREREWMDRFASLGFVDTFRLDKGDIEKQFSWWSYRANSRQKNLGWRIDYIFAGKALSSKISATSIHAQTLGSDHCPVSAEFKVN
ncbi:UNVERIFIED_CONTAM: hypothetical protein GTU68_055148 [Idotea baltica]|nr:hypothetical protein [Idotea baltica]